jgi:hypothetical protein
MLDATATIDPPATTATTNGLHYDHTTDPDSPLADSPDTPINTVSDVAVKITSDIPEVESNVRHEPFQINLSKLDVASIPPQIDTPIDTSPSFFPPFFLSSSHHHPHPLITHFLITLNSSRLSRYATFNPPLISSEMYLWQKKPLNRRMLRWAM